MISVEVLEELVEVVAAEDLVEVSVGSETVVMAGEVYQGPYTVYPDFVGVTLPTQGKNMREDVTVNAIEVQRVSNPTGGKTVYIGGIIDG